MIDKPNSQVLKACTGLDGGVVGSGSTCGVVSGWVGQGFRFF